MTDKNVRKDTTRPHQTGYLEDIRPISLLKNEVFLCGTGL